jgi:hypothetical protein
MMMLKKQFKYKSTKTVGQTTSLFKIISIILNQKTISHSG